METVLLVIHLLLVAAMIGVILVQRSEGGALGIGGDTNFMATRGTGNVLTRATTILAVGFFVTSVGLTILARSTNDAGNVFDNLPVNELPADAGGAPAAGAGGLLNLLGGADTTPAVPADAGDTATPATDATPAGSAAVPASGGASAAAPVVPADAGAGGAGAAAPAGSAAAPAAVPAAAGN